MRFLRKTVPLLTALAVVGVTLTTAMHAFPASPAQPAEKAEYTVASTEMGSAGAIVAAPVPLTGGLSERLILVGVGTLLLGLAAAVRRAA